MVEGIKAKNTDRPWRAEVIHSGQKVSSVFVFCSWREQHGRHFWQKKVRLSQPGPIRHSNSFTGEKIGIKGRKDMNICDVCHI